MGKSPKPLSYLIHPSLIQSDEDRAFIEEKRAQGHTILVTSVGMGDSKMLALSDVATYDIILAPNAWRAFDMSSFDLATKAARAVKYKPGTRKPKKARKPRKKKSEEEIAEAT